MTRIHRTALSLVTLAVTLTTSLGLAAELQGVSVRDTRKGTELQFEADQAFKWVASIKLDGRLIITFLEVDPAPSLADLEPTKGLVEAVNFGRNSQGLVEATITTRHPASHTFSDGDDGLLLKFRKTSSTPAATGDPTAPFEEAEATASLPDAFSTRPDQLGYRVGTGDVLEVSVFGLDDFDRKVRVLQDGTISLPLLGSVPVTGLSLDEAESKLEGMLSQQGLVTTGEVTLYVSEYASRGVSIQGAVNKPGSYQMIDNRTLLEMLGEAGGLSGGRNDGAGQRIIVLRTAGADGQERLEIDADRLLNQGDPHLNVFLLPGDVILVPHATTQRVYVSGAVESPGAVDFTSSEGITVLQAITAAGGPTSRASLRGVEVLRTMPDGSQERIKVNVKAVQKGKVDDLRLQKNDTVVVGEWIF